MPSRLFASMDAVVKIAVAISLGTVVIADVTLTTDNIIQWGVLPIVGVVGWMYVRIHLLEAHHKAQIENHNALKRRVDRQESLWHKFLEKRARL